MSTVVSDWEIVAGQFAALTADPAVRVTLSADTLDGEPRYTAVVTGGDVDDPDQGLGRAESPLTALNEATAGYRRAVERRRGE